MNHDKEQLTLEWRKEAVAIVTSSLLEDTWSYSQFLKSSGSDPSFRGEVDARLRAFLALPKYQGKIIPGFNDEK